MSVEIRPLPPEGTRYPHPRNPDGEPYMFAMVFDQDSTFAFADTATELCELLIEGYDLIAEHDIETATQERVRMLISAQVRTQAAINSEITAASDITPEELDLLQRSRDTQPNITEWGSSVPIVLIDAYYEPFDLPIPVGRPRNGDPENSNIIWLHALDEIEFLRSLHTIGEIQFAVAEHATQ